MQCPFCRADVPDLANHYGGHRCAPCPEVRMAFDPTWWPIAKQLDPVTDDDRAERRKARVQRWREKNRRQAALAAERISL